MMSDVKIKKKNNLGPDTIKAVLIVNSAMALKGTSCKDMKVKKKHMKLFKKDMHN